MGKVDIEKYNFTVQQKKILEDIKKDFLMWNECDFDAIFPNEYLEKYEGKQLSKKIFEYYVKIHQELLEKPNDYEQFKNIKYSPRKYSFEFFVSYIF